MSIERLAPACRRANKNHANVQDDINMYRSYTVRTFQYIGGIKSLLNICVFESELWLIYFIIEAVFVIWRNCSSNVAR